MAQNLISKNVGLQNVNTESVFDDFYSYLSASTGPWLTFTTNSGTVAQQTVQSAGKVSSVLLTTGGTDGNYVGFTTGVKNFQFAINNPLFTEARVVFTSQATNNANVWHGFCSAAAYPSITNGVLTLAGSQALICKLDGEDNWRVASACNGSGTQQLSDLAVVEGVPHKLQINVNAFDSANLLITYLVDGVQLKDVNSHKPIQHTVPVASSATMYNSTGCQAGSSNAQTMSVDYVSFSQIRQ